MARPEEGETSFERRILGQLLLLQGSLHVFRDFDRLAGFVREGLSRLPGIRSVRLLAADADGSTPPDDRPNRVVLPLETSETRYGSLEIEPDDPQQLASYMPLLGNVANVIAVHLERQAREDALHEVAESLRQEIERKSLAERRLEEAQHRLGEMIERDLPAARLAAETNSAAASLGAALIVPTGLDDISAVVLEHVQRLTDSPAGRVAVLTSRDGELRERGRAEELGVAAGEATDVVDPEELEEAWQSALAGGVAVFVNHPAPTPSEHAPESVVGGIRGFLAVPVLWGGETVGMIAAFNAPRPYTRDDLSLIERLASLYALAIRRYDELEEERRHGRQRQTAQRLEGLGILASGIAHEFRNLLQIIQSSAELSLDGSARSGDAKEEAEEILRATARGQQLTDQLLAFSRRAEPSLTPLEVNTVVRAVAGALERTLPRSIQIELRLSEEAGSTLGDPAQLEQVLLNLALNARDAMPDGGRLTLETSATPATQLAVQPGQPGFSGLSVLRVSDTGVGIDPDHREHIFEPFFTTKEQGEGTGLGLSVAYGIITAHGGQLTCSSRVGKGTTFEIALPRISQAEPPAEPRQRVEPPPSSARGERILVVDDEEAIRRLATRGLTNAGYRVIEAVSGEQALEIYRREGDSVDLVILDLGMEGMGGEACLEELRRLDPAVRVLVATGYAGAGQSSRLIRSGASAVLAKPFRFRALTQKIRATLDATE